MENCNQDYINKLYINKLKTRAEEIKVELKNLSDDLNNPFFSQQHKEKIRQAITSLDSHLTEIEAAIKAFSDATSEPIRSNYATEFEYMRAVAKWKLNQENNMETKQE